MARVVAARLNLSRQLSDLLRQAGQLQQDLVLGVIRPAHEERSLLDSLDLTACNQAGGEDIARHVRRSR